MTSTLSIFDKIAAFLHPSRIAKPPCALLVSALNKLAPANAPTLTPKIVLLLDEDTDHAIDLVLDHSTLNPVYARLYVDAIQLAARKHAAPVEHAIRRFVDGTNSCIIMAPNDINVGETELDLCVGTKRQRALLGRIATLNSLKNAGMLVDLDCTRQNVWLMIRAYGVQHKNVFALESLMDAAVSLGGAYARDIRHLTQLGLDPDAPIKLRFKCERTLDAFRK